MPNWDIQGMVDAVATALNDKHQYKAQINNRLRQYAATADTWHYVMTGRRIIDFSGKYLGYADETNIIKTIIHEIAHFKVAERTRRAKQRYMKGKGSLRDANAVYRYRHKRSHTNGFFKLVNELIDKVEIVYGEPLGRLTCNFCKFAGQRLKKP